MQEFGNWESENGIATKIKIKETSFMFKVIKQTKTFFKKKRWRFFFLSISDKDEDEN